jgi:hypothetical protein
VTEEAKLRHLKRLYDSIPPVKGCDECSGNNCCKTPFAVSPFERSRLPGHKFDEVGPCSFLKDGRCSIYEDRPLICRIYGTCNIGCEQLRDGFKLSPDFIWRIMNDYVILFWDADELNKTSLMLKEIYA